VDVDWAAPESFEPYEVAYPNLRWTAFYMLCTESCGGKKCLRKLVPEEDFNEHMHNCKSVFSSHILISHIILISR